MKSDRFGTVALALGAFVMLGLGLVGTLAPMKLVEPLGISLSSIASYSEIRTGYGSHLALAAFFAYGALRERFRTPALVLLAAEFVNIFAVRLLSFALDGIPPNEVFKAMVVEVALVVLSVVALARHLGRRDRAPSGLPVNA